MSRRKARYNHVLTGTVLLLRAGFEPDDTWAAELEELGYCVLYAEDVAQARVHLHYGAVDIVMVGSTSQNAILDEEHREFVASLSDMTVVPRVCVFGNTVESVYSVLLSDSQTAETVSPRLQALTPTVPIGSSVRAR